MQPKGPTGGVGIHSRARLKTLARRAAGDDPSQFGGPKMVRLEESVLSGVRREREAHLWVLGSGFEFE